MKRLVYLLIGLLMWNQSAICQDNIREIIKTPRNGQSIYYFKNGNEKIGRYYLNEEDKPFTGKFIQHNFDGFKISEHNYIDGILEGDFIEWSERNNIEFIKTKAKYKGGKFFGLYIEWWDKNVKKHECNYDENGKYHGKIAFYEYVRDNSLKSEGFYKHGLKDSIWTWYYSGGKIMSKEEYLNGEQNGDFIEYYENGNMKEKSSYIKGKREGEHKAWYLSGTLKYSCLYINGEKMGKEIYYFSDGKIDREGVYENGNKKGRFVWYNTDGTIKEETIF